MSKILLAGATGYLGKHIALELNKRKISTRVVVRNRKKFESFNIVSDEIFEAEVTEKNQLTNCCKNIDVVISTIGITKQKDGLTYMDVDYQANRNLLDEALKSGVKRFIFVSVLKAEKLKHVQVCYAKEKFSDELKRSGIDYCIVKPNGFFSDLKEFLNMAIKGKIYLFGDGRLQSNPIDGSDLARYCVDQIASNTKELEVGGPEILTQTEIAKSAFNSLNKSSKIVYIPDWIRKTVLKICSIFLPKSKFGSIEFFLNVMAIEMIAPKFGNLTISDYYKNEIINLK